MSGTDLPDVPEDQPRDPAQALAEFFLTAPTEQTDEVAYHMVKRIRENQRIQRGRRAIRGRDDEES